MRNDMFKVIVERPRWGHQARTYARDRLAGEDDLPVKIGVKRHAALTDRKTKRLSEHLNPLKRYLGKQRGRPWDDVYSEISATLAPGHVVKEHVRQHIDDFVARKVALDPEGNWVDLAGRWGPSSAPWRQPYYVDPRDGILKDSDKLWKKLGLRPNGWRRRAMEAWHRRDEDPNVRPIDAIHELRCLDGIWYEVTYDRESKWDDWQLELANQNGQPASNPDRGAFVFDLVKRQRVPARFRHAVHKRQLSGSELQRFGLANQAP